MVLRTRLVFLPVYFAALVVVCVPRPLVAAKPAPPPPPPPVYYVVTWLGTFGGAHSGAFDINNRGTVVGYADNLLEEERAFVCLTEADPRLPSVPLNTLIDLNTLGEFDSPGWIAQRAEGINDLGQIVGWARASGWMRGFVFDPTVVVDPDVDRPRFILLPGPPAGPYAGPPDGPYGTRAIKINNVGEVVGDSARIPDGTWSHVFRFNIYSAEWTEWSNGPTGWAVQINDAGQILTDYARFTPNGGWQYVQSPVTFLRGMNQVGVVSGGIDVSYYLKKKLVSDYAIVRLTDPSVPTTSETIFNTESKYEKPSDINSHGDVVIHWATTNGYRRPVLFTNEHGAIKLDDTVIGDPAHVAAFLVADPHPPVPTAMTEREDATGFPAICGTRGGGENDQAFLLLPAAAE